MVFMMKLFVDFCFYYFVSIYNVDRVGICMSYFIDLRGKVVEIGGVWGGFIVSSEKGKGVIEVEEFKFCSCKIDYVVILLLFVIFVCLFLFYDVICVFDFKF